MGWIAQLLLLCTCVGWRILSLHFRWLDGHIGFYGLDSPVAFFPRASERRVLLIVGSVICVCHTSSHLHVFTSSHTFSHLTSRSTHIFISSHIYSHLHTHIFIFSCLHILTSSHLHLHIFTYSHLHTHIFTSSHTHIFIHILTYSHSHLHI